MSDDEDREDIFVGIDWGSEKHQVCVLDSRREVLLEAAYEHSGSALEELAGALLRLSDDDARRVVVAIEVPRGAIVETLLEREMAVFSINPRQLDRFRDRPHVGQGALRAALGGARAVGLGGSVQTGRWPRSAAASANGSSLALSSMGLERGAHEGHCECGVTSEELCRSAHDAISGAPEVPRLATAQDGGRATALVIAAAFAALGWNEAVEQ